MIIPRYRNTSQRIKKLISENPNQPNEVFLKWINFALQNGPLPELVPSSVNMSLIEYFFVDLIAVFICSLSFMVYFGSRLFKLLKKPTLKEKTQ